ncbi:hypothetical protein BJF78_21680 [Pseudonocardia sp. CNS-139]|nr:hypothetical protein BJF78_21680 [Pseudonocardia sp. CNS-139]
MVPGRWVKSSRSTDATNCVEVRVDDDVYRVRDTKDRGAGPILLFSSPQWRAFVAGVKAGEFD